MKRSANRTTEPPNGGIRITGSLGVKWVTGSDPETVDACAGRLEADGHAVGRRMACVVVRRDGREERTYTRLCSDSAQVP